MSQPHDEQQRHVQYGYQHHVHPHYGHHTHAHQPAIHDMPQMFTLVDPFVFQVLQTLVSQAVVIQTTRGNMRGVLRDVKPDHVVLETSGTPFFIRTQEIVWVTIARVAEQIPGISHHPFVHPHHHEPMHHHAYHDLSHHFPPQMRDEQDSPS